MRRLLSHRGVNLCSSVAHFLSADSSTVALAKVEALRDGGFNQTRRGLTSKIAKSQNFFQSPSFSLTSFAAITYVLCLPRRSSDVVCRNEAGLTFASPMSHLLNQSKTHALFAQNGKKLKFFPNPLLFIF